jgi:phage terminase large subunit-like protein
MKPAARRTEADGLGGGQRPRRAKGQCHHHQASGTAKIDPLMAAFNAIAWMAANPASSQPSIFVI